MSSVFSNDDVVFLGNYQLGNWVEKARERELRTLVETSGSARTPQASSKGRSLLNQLQLQQLASTSLYLFRLG